MQSKKQRITVGFIFLGCPKNVVDSERMLAEIAQAGFIITAEPYEAQIVVVNTCAFIAPAQAESIETIKNAIDCKYSPKQPVEKVIVAGCLPERLGRDISSQIHGIDAIISIDNRDNIVKTIRKALASDKSIVSFCPTLGPENSRIPDDRIRLLITAGHWAYLRISEGCNHRCSFCTIPSIRGRFRSKPPDLILDEARELVDSGVVELNIIAQDTTSYGRDLQSKYDLADLLTGLDKIEPLRWIRLMYSYPNGISDKLIQTIANSQKIVHYLDIPIQHVNNQILKSMARPDTNAKLRATIEKLRVALPDIVLRTTLIVGYPGETPQQFRELLDFIKWAMFDALGGFQYYREAGTKAAELPGQVADKIKKQRLEELMLCQQEIAFNKNRSKIGQNLLCLVDSRENENAIGRYFGQAPEIDSICIIKNCNAKQGDFINTKVASAKDYDLIVEQI